MKLEMVDTTKTELGRGGYIAMGYYTDDPNYVNSLRLLFRGYENFVPHGLFKQIDSTGKIYELFYLNHGFPNFIGYYMFYPPKAKKPNMKFYLI